jgi:hypothetical protein
MLQFDDCIVAGRDGLKQEEILYDWDKEEQATWMREHLEAAKLMPDSEKEDYLAKARREKWKRDFLILGEMGLAYDLAATSAKKSPGNRRAANSDSRRKRQIRGERRRRDVDAIRARTRLCAATCRRLHRRSGLEFASDCRDDLERSAAQTFRAVRFAHVYSRLTRLRSSKN